MISSSSEAFVDEGPTLKRIRPRAQGRAFRIGKRTSHITVIVSDGTVVEQPVAARAAAKAKAASPPPPAPKSDEADSAADESTAKKSTAKKSTAKKTTSRRRRRCSEEDDC